MRRYITGSAIALSLAALMSACQLAEKIYPYPFETAKIEFALNGNMQGSTSVSIKGDKSVHETHGVSTIAGTEEKIDTLIIDAGDFIYTINLNTKEGSKAPNTLTRQLREIPKEERLKFLTRIATGMNGAGTSELVPVSTKTVAGQVCEVYTIEVFGEVCLWNGIPLASNVSIPEVSLENSTEATSIELNGTIPDSVFEVPEGIILTEANS
ncbi:MAG TPA: hypothetical protein VI588_03350 [Candidatus Gracilibacteria bacterium]|nr:hypothetical protein [Candidatus Gracilibacteria bacterium]